MKNSMRLERLNKLIEVVSLHVGKRGKPVKLNGVERKWDMTRWDCGTATCALGSAALHPWFKRRGLKMRNDILLYIPVYVDTSGNYHSGYDAGMKFFGITVSESHWLFWSSTYDKINITPTDVVRRIKRLIRDYESQNKDD